MKNKKRKNSADIAGSTQQTLILNGQGVSNKFLAFKTSERNQDAGFNEKAHFLCV
jgi:hypothetical protein